MQKSIFPFKPKYLNRTSCLVSLIKRFSDDTRLTASRASATTYRGPCVVGGWIKAARHQRKFSFINIMDGLSKRDLQIVAPASLISDVSGLRVGASIKVEGMLVDSPAKGQCVELQADKIDLLGQNDDTYPFVSNTHAYSPDYIRQYLHLRSKKPEFSAMLRLRSKCRQLIHKYFAENDFVQIDTPILTTNDCEGAGETFSVGSLMQNRTKQSFFGETGVNLTVSGQLHLEASNSGIAKVYTFGPAFRADNAVDTTHLAEFYMIEGEIAFINGLEDLLECVEDLTKYVAKSITENEQEDIEALSSGSTGCGQHDITRCISNKFHRITYTEAIKLLKSASEDFSFKPKYGEDIRREHEKYILKVHDSVPVFITDWPKKLKPFYMYVNEDGETVSCMDLIVPGPGELVGGSVRENRHGVLKKALEDADMLESCQWYLDIRQYGSVPHAGFGMGFERFLQFLFGIKQIRDTLPFPRYANNCRL